VYDDYFETVHSSEDEEPKSWPELITSQTFRNDLDDEDYVPLLADEWLNEAEVADRHRAELERRGGAPVDQVLPPDPHRAMPDNMHEAFEEHATPTDNEQHSEVKGEPPPSDSPDKPPESPDLRRSVRNHRTPTRFTFNRQHGYMAVKAIQNLVMKRTIGSQCELKYIYALLFDQNFGLLDNLMPNVIGQCPHLMKASANDPDTPTLSEAMSGPHRDEFVSAMKAEIEELEFHETWKVLPRTSVPKGANILPGTWAFKVKRFPDGRVRKFKARYCAGGHRQVEGVDYFDKYAPVVAWSTVRMLLTLSLSQGWATKQVDFSNAFVQATLKEEVYVSLPATFGDDQGNKNSVLKLNKSLYGLVQSPLYWFNFISATLDNRGFKPSNIDPCLFYGRGMVILVYVDDCLFFGPDMAEMDKVIAELRQAKLALTVEEDVYPFLGVEIKTNNETSEITLTQTGLIDKVLKVTGLQDSNHKHTPASTVPLGTDANGTSMQESWNYASVVGMLMYLANNSRPDIQFAVHQCARFTHCPKQSHAEGVKRVCRYLAGTSRNGLTFKPTNQMKLDCYVDADFAGLWNHEDDQDPVCVKSRTGYVMTLGGCPLHFVSKLQTEIALSTLEAEYIALSQSMRDLLPMRDLLQEIGTKLNLDFANPAIMHSTVFEDNNGALGLATSPRITPRTKHIAVKYHFFRNKIGKEKGIIIEKIDTAEQKADIFTKGMPSEGYRRIRKLMAGW